MTPDQARRYVGILDLYAGDIEALVGETRADKPGLTSALNPHLHDMARGVAIVREKITADAENMTRMIAGMREEWGVSWDDDPSGNSRDWGFPTRAAAERWEKANRHYGPGRGHAIRRYIIEPEEA